MNACATAQVQDDSAALLGTPPANEIAAPDAQPPALAQATPTVQAANEVILAALARGYTPEQIEKLMDLMERFERREAEKAYNEAFAQFKSESINILKRRHVNYTSKRTSAEVDFKHAELANVVDELTPALSRHGFGASWRITEQKRDWIVVQCTLRHRLGHSESVELGGPPDESGGKNANQSIGSACTYLERYTLKAICGVAEKGDDNDGMGGGEPTGAQQSGPRGEAKEVPSRLDTLKAAGDAEARKGMTALTRWWGALTASDRTAMNPYFGAMRKAARAVDQEAAHA